MCPSWLGRTDSELATNDNVWKSIEQVWKIDVGVYLPHQMIRSMASGIYHNKYGKKYRVWNIFAVFVLNIHLQPLLMETLEFIHDGCEMTAEVT